MRTRKLYAVFVIFLLAVWLVTPTLALAQDEIPPIETPTETPTEAQTETPTEILTEVPLEVTVEEVQEQLPEGTELVILDETGLEVPLDSEEADGLLATGDPVFCPCGALLGSPSCVSPARFTLAESVVDAQNDTSGCNWGTIYIENGATVGTGNTAVVLNANLLPAQDNTVFHIYGGIDFNPASPTYGQTIGVSTLNRPLTIQAFTGGIGSVHISNLIIAPPATATTNALNIINSDRTELDDCTITDSTDHNAVNINSSMGVQFYDTDVNDSLNGSGIIIQNGSNNFDIESGTVTESGGGSGISVTGSGFGDLESSMVSESGVGHAISLDSAEDVDIWVDNINEADDGSAIQILDLSNGINVWEPTIQELGDNNGITVNDSYDIYIYYADITEYDNGSGIVINNGSYDVALEHNIIEEHHLGDGVNITNASIASMNYDDIEEWDDGAGVNINTSTIIDLDHIDVYEYSGGAAIRIQNGSTDVTVTEQYLEEHGPGAGMNITNAIDILIQGGEVLMKRMEMLVCRLTQSPT